eukprot:2470614-Alexandrium_andersonii.AAC.1
MRCADRATRGLPRMGSAPPDPPEKRLRRARRPASPADSISARRTAQNAPLGSFGDQQRCCTSGSVESPDTQSFLPSGWESAWTPPQREPDQSC